MSRPIVVIVCMDAPPNRGSFNSAHIFGTHVPVEEPSTASGPDMRFGSLRARCAQAAIRSACTAIAAIVDYDSHIIWFGAVLLLYSLFQMHSYAFACLFPNSR